MLLSSYVEQLGRHLEALASTGGPEVAQAAGLLVTGAEPALRLVMLDLLTAAAAEVGDAVGTDVHVRLRSGSREAEIVVDAPPAAPAPDPLEAEDDTTRITLRLPSSLKDAAERRAAASGGSLNAFLVAAVKRALDVPPAGQAAGSFRLRGYGRA